MLSFFNDYQKLAREETEGNNLLTTIKSQLLIAFYCLFIITSQLQRFIGFGLPFQVCSF